MLAQFCSMPLRGITYFYPGRGVLPYISHIGMCRAPKGMVFEPFPYENWCRLFLFWSGIGYGCRGNYGIVKVFVTLFQFQIWLYWTFEMDFKISLCWRSELSNDDIFSANVRSENRYGF